MKYLKAPKDKIVKSRVQYCSRNFKIAVSFKGGPFSPNPHWVIAPRLPLYRLSIPRSPSLGAITLPQTVYFGLAPKPKFTKILPDVEESSWILNAV